MGDANSVSRLRDTSRRWHQNVRSRISEAKSSLFGEATPTKKSLFIPSVRPPCQFQLALVVEVLRSLPSLVLLPPTTHTRERKEDHHHEACACYRPLVWLCHCLCTYLWCSSFFSREKCCCRYLYFHKE